MRYRVRTEIEYFVALCEWPLPELKSFPKGKFDLVRSFYKEFNEAAAEKIKSLEKITNHDVKAIEYYLKEKFDEHGLSSFKRISALRTHFTRYQQYRHAVVVKGVSGN